VWLAEVRGRDGLPPCVLQGLGGGIVLAGIPADAGVAVVEPMAAPALRHTYADYALISFVRGDFVMSRSILRLMSYTALLTMLFSPLVFWLLYRLAMVFDHSLYPEAGKNKRRSF
jgi:hypothetical protein